MKVFQQRELRAAFDHANGGGQALHLMDGSFAYMQPRTPNCFKGRRQIAHLLDNDVERLCVTARRLGVRVIKIERSGWREGQHIDLCGRPLERALQEAET